MRQRARVFTREEASRLVGRRVKLSRCLACHFVGETGVVDCLGECLHGYQVHVRWDIHFGSGRERGDWFTADDFEAYVREV